MASHGMQEIDHSALIMSYGAEGLTMACERLTMTCEEQTMLLLETRRTLRGLGWQGSNMMNGHNAIQCSFPPDASTEHQTSAMWETT